MILVASVLGKCEFTDCINAFKSFIARPSHTLPPTSRQVDMSFPTYHQFLTRQENSDWLTNTDYWKYIQEVFSIGHHVRQACRLLSRSLDLIEPQPSSSELLLVQLVSWKTWALEVVQQLRPCLALLARASLR